jgi:hypothetical protein
MTAADDLSEMENYLCEAQRLADAIGELQISRMCAPEYFHVTDEQWRNVVEVLQDRLRADIRKANEIFQSSGTGRPAKLVRLVG